MAEHKGPDYTLNVFRGKDPETHEDGLECIVQTTKIFVSFRYDILVDGSIENRTLTLRIKGLHAPELLMPGSGPAIGRCHFPELFGHYHLIVIKQDKSENEFDIDVSKDTVTILRAPSHPFIQISADPVSPS